MTVKSVKVWSKYHGKVNAKNEYRVYVTMKDGRQGCKYLTGNGWHERGSTDGDLTDTEWAAAKRMAVWNKVWHTVYN